MKLLVIEICVYYLILKKMTKKNGSKFWVIMYWTKNEITKIKRLKNRRLRKKKKKK